MIAPAKINSPGFRSPKESDDHIALEAEHHSTRFQIEPAVHCIFVRWSGWVSKVRLASLIHDIESDPAFIPGFNRFLDFREAMLDLPTADLRSIAEFEMQLAMTARFKNTAVLVASDLNYGMMRIVMALADMSDRSFRPFLELDRARDWLKLPTNHSHPWS